MRICLVFIPSFLRNFIEEDKMNLKEYKERKLITANTPITNLEIEFKSKITIDAKTTKIPINTTVKYSIKVIEYIFIRPIRPRLACSSSNIQISITIKEIILYCDKSHAMGFRKAICYKY